MIQNHIDTLANTKIKGKKKTLIGIYYANKQEKDELCFIIFAGESMVLSKNILVVI